MYQSQSAQVNISLENAVLTLQFNRLSKKNAITQQMYSSLNIALESAKLDADVKVVIFQSNQGCFTAGNDLADFLHFEDNDPKQNNTNIINKDSAVYRFLINLRDFNKPILAAVSGVAVGIGTTLLLHCDLVFADSTAIFSMPFTQLGVCAEAGSSLLLPKQIGYHKAAEWLLLGEPHSAAEALTVGLINAIVDDVNGHTNSVASRLTKLPQDGVLTTRRLLKKHQMGNTRYTLDSVIDEEISEFSRLLELDEVKQRVSAFINKKH